MERPCPIPPVYEKITDRITLVGISHAEFDEESRKKLTKEVRLFIQELGLFDHLVLEAICHSHSYCEEIQIDTFEGIAFRNFEKKIHFPDNGADYTQMLHEQGVSIAELGEY